MIAHTQTGYNQKQKVIERKEPIMEEKKDATLTPPTQNSASHQQEFQYYKFAHSRQPLPPMICQVFWKG